MRSIQSRLLALERAGGSGRFCVACAVLRFHGEVGFCTHSLAPVAPHIRDFWERRAEGASAIGNEEKFDGDVD